VSGSYDGSDFSSVPGIVTAVRSSGTVGSPGVGFVAVTAIPVVADGGAYKIVAN
jgi:hypothetical protein